MSRPKAHALLAVAVAAAVCCTSWGAPRARDGAPLEPGAGTIRVTLTGGERLVLEHAVVDGDTLIGDRYVPVAGREVGATTRVRVAIPVAQVDSIAGREFDAPLTMAVGMAALIVGVVASGGIDVGPSFNCYSPSLR